MKCNLFHDKEATLKGGQNNKKKKMFSKVVGEKVLIFSSFFLDSKVTIKHEIYCTLMRQIKRPRQKLLIRKMLHEMVMDCP